MLEFSGWELLLFVLLVIIIIIILFAFGLKIKERDNLQMEKYFKPKH
jgi:hypothetical protein